MKTATSFARIFSIWKKRRSTSSTERRNAAGPCEEFVAGNIKIFTYANDHYAWSRARHSEIILGTGGPIRGKDMRGTRARLSRFLKGVRFSFRTSLARCKFCAVYHDDAAFHSSHWFPAKRRALATARHSHEERGGGGESTGKIRQYPVRIHGPALGLAFHEARRFSFAVLRHLDSAFRVMDDCSSIPNDRLACSHRNDECDGAGVEKVLESSLSAWLDHFLERC